MNKLTYILIAVLSFNAYGQDDTSGIDGIYSSVLVMNYSTELDKEVFANRTEYQFNDLGDLIKKFEYKPGLENKMPEFENNTDEYTNEDVFYAVTVNTYDNAGKLNRSFLNERSQYADRIVQYYRDENGNDTLIETYSMKEVLIGYHQKKYNDKGLLVSWLEMDIKNDRVNSTGTVTYEFDEAGKLKKMIKDSANYKKAIPKFIVEYDSDGRPTERYHLKKDKSKVIHYKRVYDAKHLQEATLYKEGIKSVKYSYDEAGRLIEMEKFDKDGEKRFFIRQTTYNEQGDMIHRQLTQTLGNMTIEWDYEYEYDDKGNWIVKKESENDRAYRVVKRQITYQ